MTYVINMIHICPNMIHICPNMMDHKNLSQVWPIIITKQLITKARTSPFLLMRSLVDFGFQCNLPHQKDNCNLVSNCSKNQTCPTASRTWWGPKLEKIKIPDWEAIFEKYAISTFDLIFLNISSHSLYSNSNKCFTTNTKCLFHWSMYPSVFYTSSNFVINISG